MARKRRGKPINRISRSANGTIDYQALAAEVAASAPEAILVRSEATATESAAREVVVQFRAQDATDVRIAGDFNGWVPDKGVRSMIQSDGAARVWTKILQLPPGTYEYRYVVDGEWQADPDNPNTAEGPVGNKNSVLIVH